MHSDSVIIELHDHPDATEWTEAAVRTQFPGSTLRRVADPPQAAAPSERWFLPFRFSYLKEHSYRRAFLRLFLRNRAVFALVNREGDFVDPVTVALEIVALIQPLAAAILIVRAPVYFWRELLRHFCLSRSDTANPIVGYGAPRGAGGLIYWDLLVRKSRRYGLYGLATDTYFGQPLSVHSWPLAIVILRALGYRAFIAVSTALIVGAMVMLVAYGGHAGALWLLPLILCSTYFTLNLNSGTWELLAWGIASVAVVVFVLGHPILCGLLLAATLLSHPGVCELAIMIVALATFVFHLPLLSLVIAGLSSIPLSLFFVGPYWRSRRKLGRQIVLNRVFAPSRKWNLASFYNFACYIAFAIAALFSPAPRITIALLLLPALLQFTNTKLTWVFSNYTISNLFLVVGWIELVLYPAVVPLIVYLLVIFTEPSLLSSVRSTPLHGFDLSPLRLGRTADRVRRAFAGLTGGRIAFESNGLGTEMSYNVATISWILADDPLDLFNAAYSEVGDAAVYFKFVQAFQPSATREELESACRGSGVKYVVAFTDAFMCRLNEYGFRFVTQERGLLLSHLDDVPADVAIFEFGEEVTLIEPPVAVDMATNILTFRPQIMGVYVLRYTAFKGWRATQNGRHVPIGDASPGMLLHVVDAAPVTLRYRYWNYFLP